MNDFKILIDDEEKYADYTIRKLFIYNQSEVCNLHYEKTNKSEFLLFKYFVNLIK